VAPKSAMAWSSVEILVVGLVNLRLEGGIKA
jgi:hypothetical protein